MQKQLKGSLTEGVIWKQILRYFFPILLGTFFQQLYNTVDAWVVGNFEGDAALAAVGGTTGTIISLLVNFFVGLSSGATVVLSQFYGRGDEDGAHKAVHTAIALSIAGGAVLMVIGFILAPWALHAMGATADVIDGAISYVRIYFIGIIGNLLYNMGSGILRAVGDSKRPMIFLIICCLFNIVLDLLFVAVFRMGVTGAAIATILSQLISAILVLWTLMRAKGECYRLQPRSLGMDKVLLPEILRIGLPIGLQSTMYNIANIIIQSNINSFGTNAMAANTAYGRVDSIFWMIIGAYGVTLVTFVGQNYGARKYGRIRRGFKTCFLLSATTTIGITALMIGFGRPLLRIFTKSEDVISIGLTMMLWEAPFYICYVPIEMFSGTMRGMGNSLSSMLTICGGICGFRLLWLFLVLPLNKTVPMLMLSYGLSWTLTSIIMLIIFIDHGKKTFLIGENKLQ